MKRVFIALAIFAVVAAAGFADWRADIGVDIPWQLGATVEQGVLGDDPQNESLNVLAELTILLPEVMIGYEGRLGPVNVGAGARVFTFILESLLYPAAFAEVDVGPVAVNLNVGGGGFLFFGLANQFQTANLWIPDLSAHLKLGESLRVGVGMASFLGGETQQVFPYVIYLSGKFVVRF
jgi:hypothetical protein